VLRYLGGEAQPVAAESVALLRTMLHNDAEPRVLGTIGYALGQIGLPARVDLMCPFAEHSSADVRYAVVAALLGSDDARAVATLIALSRDADDKVRDWATFGLGSQLGPQDPEQRTDPGVVDTDALRDALAARLDDPHDDTRCEAIVGLAMRRDPRVLTLLRDEIARGPACSLIVLAARYMASPDLCAGLRALAASDDVSSVAFWNESGLKEAIAACCGASPRSAGSSDS
jgi:HEAT repeat protein